ncbi:uncharacterized protein TNCV_3338451 [Trichonephila clavipes]|nr:uncharacterized protein TNCV_3338451 [Trichonephila clavipes]
MAKDTSVLLRGKVSRRGKILIVTTKESGKLNVWLATLIAVPLGLGSNPGEDMDICKCTVPSQHGCSLNSRRAANPLVRLVEGKERWKALDHPQGVLKIGLKPSCHLFGAQSYD